jgi:CheY-like chemotaxis protein/HPt (histidine-containing phosphotransfer) domain-containing protein
VLVVDDNDTNRRILERSLLSWESRADVASSGSEALAILREAAAAGDPIPIGLVDFNMPGMDGLELARQVRGDTAIAATRLVLLTSASHRSGLGASMEAGFDGYLTKPVRQSSLAECLRTVLGREATQPDRPLVTAQVLADSRAAGKVHILVVEDNLVNQKVAAGMLKKLGFRVDVAANGAEAVDALSRRHYGAVLMDCQMPVLDGYEATEEIRRREDSGTHVPIIAMTAGALDTDRDRCLAAGMDDYITKPVKAERLAEALAHWTGDPNRGVGEPSNAGATVAVEPDLMTRWAELAEMVGAETTVGYVRMFLEDATAQLAALREALKAEDFETISRLSHSLKGSAATLGAGRVASLCTSIGAAASRQDRTELSAALSLLDIELAGIPEALSAFSGSGPHRDRG